MKRILGVLIAVAFMSTVAFAAAPMSDTKAKNDPAVGKTAVAVDLKAECKGFMAERKALREEIKLAKEKKDKKALSMAKKKMKGLKAKYKAAGCSKKGKVDRDKAVN
jgi:hypothetical protein